MRGPVTGSSKPTHSQLCPFQSVSLPLSENVSQSMVLLINLHFVILECKLGSVKRLCVLCVFYYTVNLYYIASLLYCLSIYLFDEDLDGQTHTYNVFSNG